MQNPNQRGPYGPGRGTERSQNTRYGRNDDRWDEPGYASAYSNADQGYDEAEREQSARYRDYADERASYAGYASSQSRPGFEQERYARNSYLGGAREYGSGSRQYRDEEPGRELYSSRSRGGSSYEWRQGQGRQPGNRQNWQSQSGYYREREPDYASGRYQPSDYRRESSSRYSSNDGAQSRDYSGNRYASAYAQRDYGGYAGDDLDEVYGYTNSPYARPGMTQDIYGREYGNPGRYAGGTGYPAQRYAAETEQRPRYPEPNERGNYRTVDQDNYSSQSFRGRGPKNYTRSDERIREDLSERLSNHHDIDASEVNVEVKNGVVTLTGTIDQRHLKHAIEDLAEHCSGVKDVENRLTVNSRLTGAKSAQAGQHSSKNENAGNDNATKKH